MTALRLMAALLGAACIAGAVRADTLVGLDANRRLFAFDTAAPGSTIVQVPLIGPQPRDSRVGIDFRPGTDALIGVSRIVGEAANAR